MKIKIELDLEDTIQDMFEDDSNDLNAAVKGEVIRAVMGQVMPKMKTSIDQLVSVRIDAIIKDRVEKTVDATLNKALEGDCLITVNRETKTVQKHIQDLFNSSSRWNNPNEKVAEIAKKFGQELKLQYNNVFAMNIVSNLKENNMLKDDVALMLTEQPKAPEAK